MKKIVVYVPLTHTDVVREAIGKAGGGKLGKYSFCTFSTRGIGRFRPMVGYIGNFRDCSKPSLYSSPQTLHNVHNIHTLTLTPQ